MFQNFLVFIFLLLFSFSLTAAEVARATIKSVSGNVEVDIFGVKWEPAAKDMKLYEKSKVRTDKKAKCEIELANKRIVKMKEDSEMQIAEFSVEGTGVEKKIKVQLNLNKGYIFSNVKSKLSENEKFNIKTPTAVCGVRGTQFATESEEDNTMVSVLNGEVQSYNPLYPSDIQSIKGGQFSTIGKSSKPSQAQALSADALKSLGAAAEEIIVNEKININMIPEFLDYSFTKISAANYLMKLKVKRCNPKIQDVYLHLFIKEKNATEPQFVKKMKMNITSQPSDNVDAEMTFEANVVFDKQGKYSYRFSVENAK